jgi:hypothetical protein
MLRIWKDVIVMYLLYLHLLGVPVETTETSVMVAGAPAEDPRRYRYNRLIEGLSKKVVQVTFFKILGKCI